MAEFPAMPLWCQRYFGDTRHLRNAEEHGAYLLLLMEAWLRPSCSLPDDDVLLARLACCEPDDWQRLKPVIMSFWTLDKRRAEWTQKGQMKERAHVASKSDKQRDRALSGWEKRKNIDAAAMPEKRRGNGAAMPPTPTPTPRRKKEPPNPQKGDENKIDEFENWYEGYPLKKAKGAARRAFSKARKKTDLETLIAGLKKYVAEVAGKEQTFIAHPATWLNGERWLDSDKPESPTPGPAADARRLEIAKDWLSRHDDIPSWMDIRDTAERLIVEGYDYDRLRKAGFSLPPRGNVVNIGSVTAAISEAKRSSRNEIR